MTKPKMFDPELWDRDLYLLPLALRALAVDALQFSRQQGCEPYHRKSKPSSHSDQQTILKHQDANHISLVISVVPDPDDKKVRALRIDFIDRLEVISVPPFAIFRAPAGQWENKAERRTFVRSSTSSEAMNQLVLAILRLPK
jgi:hypothetical protein